jgi:hypothetical protein
VDFDLFISLNNTSVDTPVRLLSVPDSMLGECPVLRTASPDKPQIAIDWKDFGAPPVPPSFFFELFKQLKAGKARKVAVYCMGGHGRTGTFLSLLYHAMGQKDVIALARAVYCDKSVETPEQIAYLKSAGADVGTATPSYHPVVAGRGQPSCDHVTHPWEYRAKAKGGTKAGKATARLATGCANHVTSNTRDPGVRCVKPFRCVYDASDPFCVHCGTHRDDLVVEE